VQLQHEEESGSLEQVSFSLLLIRALDKRWTGTLLIDPPSGHQQLIQIDRGLICRVVVPDGYARLGDIMVEAGVVLDKELQEALSDERLLGQALADAEVIDEKTLQRALVLQLLKRLERIFGFPVATTWSFGSELSAFEEMPPGVRIDTLRVLWAGITAHGEMGNWLTASVKRIGESRFKVRKDVNMRRFGFTGDARKLVRVIRDERVNVSALVELAIAPEEVVHHIVYLMAITRYLDFSPVGKSDGSLPVPSPRLDSSEDMPSISEEVTIDEAVSSSDAPPDSSATSSQDTKPSRRVARIRLRRVAMSAAAPDPPGSGEPTAPLRSSPGASSTKSSSSDGDVSSNAAAPSDAGRDTLLSDVRGRLARLEGESAFASLDVEPESLEGKSEDEITEFLWTAFETAAKRWNPDNCPNDLSELAEGMAKIYRTMGEAFATLVDPALRPAAMEALRRTNKFSELPSTMRSEGSAPPPVEEEAPPSGERAVQGDLSPTELHARALTALSEQRADEALRLVRAACDAEPDNPDFLSSSVWIRASMERPDLKLLVLDLDDVLRSHRDHVTARYYRGVLRRRLGNDSAAKSDFERVLEMDPGHAGARNQLRDVTKAMSR
jgi:hypothetical protein